VNGVSLRLKINVGERIFFIYTTEGLRCLPETKGKQIETLRQLLPNPQEAVGVFFYCFNLAVIKFFN